MEKEKTAFGRTNAILAITSIVLVIVGFALMGGKGVTETQFEPDIFSFRRIVLAPGTCLLGYLLMIVAILWRPKQQG